MSKIYYLIIALLILTVGVIFLRVGNGGEDSWIKDEKGIWIKHGNPSYSPEYVFDQKQIINGALRLYELEKDKGSEFDSQCLGIVSGYAVDIVHVPRSAEDDLPENQCRDFSAGIVRNFIELDKEGNIVRIS